MRKSEKLSDAIGMVDEEIVAEAEEKRISSSDNSTKNKRRGNIIRISAAAAACAAVAGGVLLIGGNGGGNISDIIDEPAAHTTTVPTASTVPDEDTDGYVIGGPSANTTVAPTTPDGYVGGDTDIETELHAETIAEAEYPVMAQYPNEDDCFDENGIWQDELYKRYYEPWSEQGIERREAGKIIMDKQTGFVMSMSTELLSGSDGENRVYSPGSTYMALAMLAETAGGDSRYQILDLLEADSIESLRGQAENMWKANYRNDGATTSILANSLWLNESVNFNSGTLQRLADSYHASSYRGDMSSEDMTAALREWLNEQTGGFLGDSVKNVTLDPETVISLCSTVYFRAKWDTVFLPSNNDTKTFHGSKGDIEAEFMNSTDEYGPYYWGEDYGAVSLAFADGGSMWLILPDEDKTIDDILASEEYLDMVNTGYGWEKSKSIIVHYSVPKFDVASELNLADSLMRLGVTDIFDSTAADFTPLSEDSDGLFVGGAKHAARVQIDEEGCTAAAFTQMAVCGDALPPEDEIYFTLDRPFLFVIMSDTKQPLFIGTVYEP